jgi:hypothetical protein
MDEVEEHSTPHGEISFSLNGMELEDSLERDLAQLAKKTGRKEKQEQKQMEERSYYASSSTKTYDERTRFLSFSLYFI